MAFILIKLNAGLNIFQSAQKRIFTCVKGKKRPLSLSLSFSSVCVVVVVVRTHRAWCVLKAKKRKKKTTIRKKIFFYAREKAQNILHSFRFFLSLSFSFSPVVVVVVVACHHPEREREREVRASLQKRRSSSLVSRNILACALSLFFRCCSEYFLFFFFVQRKWIKKSGLCGRFIRFFDGIF